ncbi:YbfB/YjiJ family MFS transporter [Priestia megaterium]
MGLFQMYSAWYVFRFVSGFSSAFVLVLASSIVLDKLAEKRKQIGLGFSMEELSRDFSYWDHYSYFKSLF